MRRGRVMIGYYAVILRRLHVQATEFIYRNHLIVALPKITWVLIMLYLFDGANSVAFPSVNIERIEPEPFFFPLNERR